MDNEKRFQEVTDLAKELGLDPFPVVHEVIERSTMFNICAYGLPTRARHWSYGRSYDHQKTHGEMGLSKVYEIILNNNPSYAFMLDTNTKVQNLFIVAHCAGHCFVPGTLVETKNGPKPIEEITTEDLVLTHTGMFRKPMALSRAKHCGQLINLKIGSQNVQCTPEHPFLVVRHKKCSLNYRDSVCKNNCRYKKQQRCQSKPYKDYKTEWVKAKDIREKDFVVFPKRTWPPEMTTTNVSIHGKKGFGHPGGEKEVSYNIQFDEDFGEFLGLYIAEGYAREKGQMGLCFHTNETNLHQRSRQLIKKLFGLNVYDDVDQETHSHQVQFNEMVLSSWLRDNCGDSCYNKQIPFELPPNCAKAFLRGVFHGDGHNATRAITLTTTSVKLASQVRKICLDFDIKTNIKIRNQPDRHTSYVVTVSGESLTKFATETKINWDVHKGNRNYEFCWFDEDYMYTPVIEVSSFNSETEVFNIEVPEDSSYVLFAGAATHNSDFFKHNCMFNGSNRNMIRHAAEHAGRIEEYIDKYGFEKVEHIMDIGFALCNHIDWFKGLHRKPYKKKTVLYHKQKRGEFDDLLLRKQKPSVVRRTINDRFPPYHERDLLWFFINYAPLEEWEKDILDIIREEHFYFYPQMMTKIMNEGWASYWHAEIMYQYKGISSSEYLDFLRDHEKVVQPGGNPFRINPYFLGFRIFKDIEKRWDEKYGEGAGRKKIFEVRTEDDDISFLRNYLTSDLIEELNLFTYGYVKDYPKDHKGERLIEIKEKIREEVVETLVKPLYNGGSPHISITEVGPEGKLIMEHKSVNVSTLDHKFASKTLEYIWDLWAAPIELYTKDDEGEELVLCFDEAGYYEKELDEELSFDEEDEEEDEGPKKPYRGRIIIP